MSTKDQRSKHRGSKGPKGGSKGGSKGSKGSSKKGRAVKDQRAAKRPQGLSAVRDQGRSGTGELHAPRVSPPGAKMRTKEYEEQMRQLHVELVSLQEWVKATGAKIVVVFEGRDTAGKGGVIKRITERVSPRVFRVVALSAPTEREKSQMYIQRYLPHFPAAGEVVIFDRSWYNRAGVEPIMGFCTQEETDRFLEMAPQVEKAMVDSGIILLKYWLEVSAEEQTRRLEGRIHDGRKTWKLSPMDLESYSHWFDYARARDAMIEATDTGWAPWFVANTDDKKRGRLNIISHLLSQIPYEKQPELDITLPERQEPDGYLEPTYPFNFVPERF